MLVYTGVYLYPCIPIHQYTQVHKSIHQYLIFLIFIGLTTKGKVITKGNEAYRYY